MPLSPTQLTLRKLRNEGYTAEVVEHWNSFTRTRKDLFGFVDVLAVKEDETLAVQTTSFGNRLARVRKIADSDHIGACRDANWKIHVHGWRKVKNRWQCTVEDCS